MEVATQLVNCNNSKDLWNSVEEIAGAAHKAKEISYKGELQRTRKGSLKMDEYLGKMKAISDNLQLEPPSFKDLCAQILCGLDSEYTLIVTQLTYMSNLTWIEFSTALLTFESRMEQLSAIQNLSINSATANVLQSQRNGNNNNRGNF